MLKVITPHLKVGSISPKIDENKNTPLLEPCSPQRFTTWQLTPPTSPWSKLTPGTACQSIPIYCGPPRILELGCDDGSWCMLAKEKKPDWIIEGLDDTDWWSEHLQSHKTR